MGKQKQTVIHVKKKKKNVSKISVLHSIHFTLFSPGKGSIPVILRPTLFLPLVDLT